MKLVFIDTETTGLRPEVHEIIEIAIIVENNGCIQNTYHWKVKPENLENASETALQINGYNAKDWCNAVSFSQIGEQIRQILKGQYIVGHNPQFDLDFINEMLFRSHLPGVKGRLIDTKQLAFEHLYALGCTSLSFDNIRKFMGYTDKGAHTALIDAQQTRRLYNDLCRCSFLYRLYLKLRFILRG